MLRKSLFTAAIATLLGGASVLAQSPEVAAGTRVRLRLQDSVTRQLQEIHGTLARLDADSLSMRLSGGGGVLTVSRSAIQDLSRSDGIRSRLSVAANPRLLFVVASLAAMQISHASMRGSTPGTGQFDALRAGLLLSIPLGVLLSPQREKWEPVNGWAARSSLTSPAGQQ